MSEPEQLLRIGELSRRTDVDPALLRAWEKRYGLLEPQRSEGNFRLYDSDDLARVWAMKRNIGRGLAAAEAARQAKAEVSDAGLPPALARTPVDSTVEELFGALAELDEAKAHELLDRHFTLHSLEETIADLVLPTLRRIGEAWATGEISVAQEHSASALLRNRLLSVGRGWKSGAGPSAMLACPSGEQHDIGLISFGLLLWRHGWRIDYIGQDTPISELLKTIPAADPELVVLASLSREPFERAAAEIAALAEQAPVVLAGAGATDALAEMTGGVILDGDPISAARDISTGITV